MVRGKRYYFKQTELGKLRKVTSIQQVRVGMVVYHKSPYANKYYQIELRGRIKTRHKWRNWSESQGDFVMMHEETEEQYADYRNTIKRWIAEGELYVEEK